MICLAAAAGVIPITSGGVVVGAGATAGILLALGVGKDIAINFSLASGLLLVTSALAAALVGVLASLATRAMARRNPGAGARPRTDDHGERAPMTARLDWQAFCARYFPDRRRHDFEVLDAYEAYRNRGPMEERIPREAGALPGKRCRSGKGKEARSRASGREKARRNGPSLSRWKRNRCARYAFVALPSIGALPVPIAALPLPIWIRCGVSTAGFLTWTSSSPLS